MFDILQNCSRDIKGIDDRKTDDNEDVKNAYLEAVKALKLEKNERIEQLYSCVDSDEEMCDMVGSDDDGSSDEKDDTNDKSNNEGRNGNDEAMSVDDDDDAKIGIKVLIFLNYQLVFAAKINEII